MKQDCQTLPLLHMLSHTGHINQWCTPPAQQTTHTFYNNSARHPATTAGHNNPLPPNLLPALFFTAGAGFAESWESLAPPAELPWLLTAVPC